VFFARAAASRIVFPRVGLSDLCAEPAAQAIERAGGVIETGPAVREIGVENGRVTRLSFHGRPDVHPDVVVAAVPPPALGAMLPAETRTRHFERLAKLESAPIVSVHFWFESGFAAPRMAGFLDGPIHWLFTPPMQPESGRYVTLVTSGAHELVDRPPAEITAIARRELGRYLPDTGDLALADSQVVKEANATYAASPAEQRHRPGAATPIANLFLAGDWTDTGLPATLESAVVSGEKAAEAALQYFRQLG
ncbi:MAG: hydroxysqualene dehydroxylase, partial [Candidatus Binatia bacterium]